MCNFDTDVLLGLWDLTLYSEPTTLCRKSGGREFFQLSLSILKTNSYQKPANATKQCPHKLIAQEYKQCNIQHPLRRTWHQRYTYSTTCTFTFFISHSFCAKVKTMINITSTITSLFTDCNWAEFNWTLIFRFTFQKLNC